MVERDDLMPDGESGTRRMHKRPTTLADGRYLIFYTFDEETATDASPAVAPRAEPEAEPVAEEERRV